MKAILVEFSLMTRIVVPDDFNIDEPSDADYDTIREKAIPRFHEKLNTEGVGDLLVSIEEDNEILFGQIIEDEYYQPNFFDKSGRQIVEELASFEVFASKELAQKAFPHCEILTYHGGDIEEPTFVDERYK